MSKFESQGAGLNEFEQAMLDNFCSAHQAKSPLEQSMLDQASSELRDQLMEMGLSIKTDEQFYIACLVSVATAANMKKLTQRGLAPTVAETVANMTISALRPQNPAN